MDSLLSKLVTCFPSFCLCESQRKCDLTLSLAGSSAVRPIPWCCLWGRTKHWASLTCCSNLPLTMILWFISLLVLVPRSIPRCPKANSQSNLKPESQPLDLIFCILTSLGISTHYRSAISGVRRRIRCGSTRCPPSTSSAISRGRNAPRSPR